MRGQKIPFGSYGKTAGSGLVTRSAVEKRLAGILGVLVVIKVSKFYSWLMLSLGILAAFALAGCGGSSKTNVITVSVSPSAATIIVSQPITLTSVVSGTTDTSVTWACTFTTTTVDSTGKATTAAAQPCTSDTGTIPANSNSTTVTYTAPNKVPDPTKFPNLQIIITATSVANTKKTGTATLTLDSGITVSLNPPSATVPTNEHQQFSVNLFNDLQGQGVTFLITQQVPTTNRPYPSLTTCSPGCGTLSDQTANGATYIAPSTVPTTTTPASTSTEPTVTTPSTLTIVATSKADTTRFGFSTITIIQGGPITFNGVSPTIAPQGASSYDIYLDAPFMSSSSVVAFTGSKPGNSFSINSSTGQLKVLFPIPTTAITNPASTGARVRLSAQNLFVADTYTVSVSDPGEPVTNGAGPFTVTVQPVRPTSVASIPDSFPQNGTGNELNLSVDGGYFGFSGQLAVTTFNGNSLVQNNEASQSSRQLNLTFPPSATSSEPGLYPLSVSRTTLPLPANNNPSVTNIAVFPDYSTIPPAVVGAGVAAGTNPNVMDIDQRFGVLAVADTGAAAGTNSILFYSISNGALSPVPGANGALKVNVPSGLSINQSNHTIAVVSFLDQSVQVFQVPDATGSVANSGAPGVSYPFTISLAELIPTTPNFTPAPQVYSVGVDSDTNNAVVAYSSNANPTTAKIGFLLDLNEDSQTCLASLPAGTKPPCIFSQVTLNTGQYPQIAMIPHSHQALITPGGSGVVQGVDVTKSSSNFSISNISVTSGLVTVTLNIPSGQTLILNPGNPGSVLIQGVPNGSTNGVNFNGVFTILSVLNANSFTYGLNVTKNDSTACSTDTDPAKNPCQSFFSRPNISTFISQTLQGITINPITRTAAMADAAATGSNGPQIDLLNSLDQSPTSIIFRSGNGSASLPQGCTVYTTTCSNGPELLGTSSVAFQPFSNSLVSYNPQQNQLSVSNPVNQSRYAVVVLGAALAALPTATANSTTINLFGDVVVDPATNQAFVSQPATGKIQIVNLNPNPGGNPYSLFKPLEITELQVPTVAGTLIGGIAGAVMPQGTLTSTTTDLAGVEIFGTGFDANSAVRLDGTPIPSANVTVNSSRQLTVTIPKSFLVLPHRYAVDVRNTLTNVTSNVTDFFVVKAVDLSKTAVPAICKDASNNPLDAQPSSVAIADQLPGQAFSPIAVVSNTGCNSVVKVDINPQSGTFGQVIGSPIATGSGPLGVAVSPRFGLAVVANNSAGTVSILDMVAGKQKIADVTVGTTPMGVAINEGTGAALVANNGSNTVSEIDLASLFKTSQNTSPPTTLTPITIAIDTSPIAVAIDPDRGTNSGGLAVVTGLQLVSGSAPVGILDSIDIGGATPVKSTSGSVGNVTSTPTGVVFNPSVSPTVFYANSSGGNVVTAFDPDHGTTSSVHVGINPTSLALNPQTGGILTINSASQTISIIDTISNPFKTRSTFGLGGSAAFGAAIDQFTNLAVIVDQANNRLLIFPMPN